MTRETKIGLLVGLAFIIVIGILLSEHVSSTNEPQQAPLNTAGGNVRDGVLTPGATDDGPPISIAGAPVETPRRSVPTNVDLHPPAPPVAYVSAGSHATQRRGVGSDGTLAAGLDGNVSSPPGASTPAGLLQQHPDDLAPYNSNGSAAPKSSGPGVSAASGQMPQPPSAPPATYVAVAGDSVSRIAARLMGGNTRTNRDLLVRANPTLQNDRNVVVIGRTYVVPGAAANARTGNERPSPGIAAQPAPHGSAPVDPAALPTATQRWYTVKGDDNLWRIAEAQLGSGTAWTQIRDLNKDVLKGGETVHPNMRLRLPDKTVIAGAD